MSLPSAEMSYEADQSPSTSGEECSSTFESESLTFEDRLRTAQLRLFNIALNAGREAVELAGAYPPADIAKKYSLTKKETQVLYLKSQGYANKLLSRELFVTEQTIKFHLSNLYIKMGVQSNIGAISALHRLEEETLAAKSQALNLGTALLIIAGNLLAEDPEIDDGKTIKNFGDRWELQPTQVPKPLQKLTRRQLDILAMVALGLSNGEIASKMFLEEPTIKFHLTGLYRKLQVKNRVEAARVANESRLLEWAVIAADVPTKNGKMPNEPIMSGTKKAIRQLEEQESSETSRPRH